MGSFQQISIAVICLVGAFAFGNYVNTHQSGEHPMDVAEESGQVQSAGNVQSRLAAEFELVEKRPSAIATMRNRLQPRFALPDNETNSELSANSSSLPPPSQLDSNDSGFQASDDHSLPSFESNLEAANRPSEPAGLTPRIAKSDDIPDFSSIMNDLEDTPIGIQKLGQMPQHSLPGESQTKLALAKPRDVDVAPELLGANTNPFEKTTPPTDTPNPWNTEKRSEFKAEDFSPRLKDRFSNASPTETNQPIENTSVDQQPKLINERPTETQFGFPEDRSNQVVSREPIPPAPRQELPVGNSSNKIAKIQIEPRVAQAVSRDSTAANSNVIDGRDNRIANQPTLDAPSNGRVRTLLPFALNDQGRQQLAAIKSRTNSKLALNTTKYVDHVIQPGETLQSISKRYFGNPDYYLDIYLANRGKLKNPVDIQTGTSLRIPIYE